MKRGRSTGTPTKAQQARFDVMREIGCIACRMYGFGYVAGEIHHLTSGGHHGQKRRGHDYTVCLCSWHHRGVQDGYGHARGPSYAHSPKAFRATFGDDDALLAKQNELIEKHIATTSIKPRNQP